MVYVSVSETYDLSTKAGKMSLIAIRTPSKNLIKKTYPGLAVNHRFFRFVKCDVSLACASLLPADPLQIGVSSGKIAPQDMFNPILYKAITSEGLSNIESRLLGLGSGSYGNNDHSVLGESVISQNENAVGAADNFNAYYGLLSNRDGFRVAHPQTGLQMKGLVPLVYEKLYQYGQNGDEYYDGRNDQIEAIQSNEAGTDVAVGRKDNYSIKGRPHPLPKINCTYLADATSTSYGFKTPESESALDNLQGNVPDIPRCYVGMIIMPPSRLNVLYFRLHVRWFIEFIDPRPISDIVSFFNLSVIGTNFYTTDYSFSKGKDGAVEMDMLDAKDADITKIMEGA